MTKYIEGTRILVSTIKSYIANDATMESILQDFPSLTIEDINAVSKDMIIGPQNEAEQEVFAVERFRVNVQSTLYAAMKATGVTKVKLAKLMEVDDAFVEELFDTGNNLTIRVVGKFCYALAALPQLTVTLPPPPGAK